jgi:hypothetical protein
MQADIQMTSRIAARPATRAIPYSTTLWFKLAVLYLIAGIGIGIAMAASHTFTLRPVHAHINLLGFTVMALAGLIYSVYPEAGASRLARIHFWLHNIALPVMMGSLAALLFGNEAVVPILGGSEIVAAAGVLVFAANIFINVQPRPQR